MADFAEYRPTVDVVFPKKDTFDPFGSVIRGIEAGLQLAGKRQELAINAIRVQESQERLRQLERERSVYAIENATDIVEGRAAVEREKIAAERDRLKWQRDVLGSITSFGSSIQNAITGSSQITDENGGEINLSIFPSKLTEANRKIVSDPFSAYDDISALMQTWESSGLAEKSNQAQFILGNGLLDKEASAVAVASLHGLASVDPRASYDALMKQPIPLAGADGKVVEVPFSSLLARIRSGDESAVNFVRQNLPDRASDILGKHLYGPSINREAINRGYKQVEGVWMTEPVANMASTMKGKDREDFLGLVGSSESDFSLTDAEGKSRKIGSVRVVGGGLYEQEARGVIDALAGKPVNQIVMNPTLSSSMAEIVGKADTLDRRFRGVTGKNEEAIKAYNDLNNDIATAFGVKEDVVESLMRDNPSISSALMSGGARSKTAALVALRSRLDSSMQRQLNDQAVLAMKAARDLQASLYHMGLAPRPGPSTPKELHLIIENAMRKLTPSQVSALMPKLQAASSLSKDNGSLLEAFETLKKIRDEGQWNAAASENAPVVGDVNAILMIGDMTDSAVQNYEPESAVGEVERLRSAGRRPSLGDPDYIPGISEYQ